jgi:hypothetical protein
MVDQTEQAVEGRERNRRLAPRAEVALDTAYEDRERQVFLIARNISESGVFLVSADLPPVGAFAQVTLELPSDPVLLRLRGTVVRHQSEHPTGFALEFDPKVVLEPLRARVRRFVAAPPDASRNA